MKINSRFKKERLLPYNSDSKYLTKLKELEEELNKTNRSHRRQLSNNEIIYKKN